MWPKWKKLIKLLLMIFLRICISDCNNRVKWMFLCAHLCRGSFITNVRHMSGLQCSTILIINLWSKIFGRDKILAFDVNNGNRVRSAVVNRCLCYRNVVAHTRMTESNSHTISNIHMYIVQHSIEIFFFLKNTFK